LASTELAYRALQAPQHRGLRLGDRQRRDRRAVAGQVRPGPAADLQHIAGRPGEQALPEGAQPGLLGLGRSLAEQLELPGTVRDGVGAAYEQWDGRGWPGVLKADAIPVAARIAQLSEFTEVAHRVGGVAGATALARKQAGRQFDPDLSALLCARAEQILGGLEAVPAWRSVIASEPALAVELSADQLDRALAAIANFVDLKSPFTLGHSVAVAELAEEAGRRLGAAARAGADATPGRVRARVRAAGRVEFDLGPARAAERG
jgi:hypothetical protein